MKKFMTMEILEGVAALVISICSLGFAIIGAITGNQNDSILGFFRIHFSAVNFGK